MWIKILKTCCVAGPMFFVKGEIRQVDKAILKEHGHQLKGKPTPSKLKNIKGNRLIYQETVAPWDRQKVDDPVADTQRELEVARNMQGYMQVRLKELESELVDIDDTICELRSALKEKAKAIEALEKKLAGLQPQPESETEQETETDETGTETKTDSGPPQPEDAPDTEGQAASAGEGQPVQDKVTKARKTTGKKTGRNGQKKRSKRKR